ncbi:MAG: hypothetical protein EA341_13640, partial [Mongoliibacter sp.]|uniref:hypothetical protein n=1 Tax=Mongoliibacter sp. TaxID=2022438 RepID=UPI0012F301F4
KSTETKTNQKHLELEPGDFKVRFDFRNGESRTLEFPYGAGYLSQSSRKIPIPENCKEIQVIGFDGSSRKVDH